jgi:hypothetical protein
MYTPPPGVALEDLIPHPSLKWTYIVPHTGEMVKGVRVGATQVTDPDITFALDPTGAAKVRYTQETALWRNNPNNPSNSESDARLAKLEAALEEQKALTAQRDQQLERLLAAFAAQAGTASDLGKDDA